MRQGSWYLAIGVVHTIVGVVFGWRELVGIAADGFVAAIPALSVREDLFWYLVTGFVLMLVGALCNWIEREARLAVPSFVAWSLLAMSVIGVIAMPASGFWLMVVAAAAAIKGSARRRS